MYNPFIFSWIFQGLDKKFRSFLTLSSKNYAIWLSFECARAKTAGKSSDLLHRSCWVALEIHTLRTSPRMEVPLGTIYVSCQKSSYIFPKISEWKTQRQTTLIHIADSNVIQKNVDKQCLISREEKVLHTTIQFIDNNDN